VNIYYDKQKPITVICGHYGTGKTNVAVNIALNEKSRLAESERLILLDMDIVNPYFRSSDNAGMLKCEGIDVIVPQYAGTNVDVPSILPDIARIFLPGNYSVLDVGGDDSGATVLSVYKERIIEKGYRFFYVINQSRPFISTPEAAIGMLADIESASGLKACGIINNTSMGEETTADIIRDSFDYCKKVCALSGLPLAATTVFDDSEFSEKEKEEYKITKILSVTKKIY